MEIELRLWSGSEITQEYIEAHSKSKAKYYSGSGAREFDRDSILDEILVACFNPSYFPKSHFRKYTTTFEDIYNL